MRALLLVCGLAAVAGCSTLPDPDPHQAWVDLAAGSDNSLKAVKVDNHDWTDPRYFEVQPGAHELWVTFQFPVAPTNIGPVAQPLWRDCKMKLSFKDFSAGQRYRLEAGSLGFQPWAKLYDEQRYMVGKAQPAGCQAT
ncbi:hypothetical protein RAM80_17260 [Pseudomonas sp. App30]|uniref:PA0061/PA0062 family lipoprotein n=1 Tax=Pseudomonas sp. App30 TaxID=3068990 RepID=UPI003A80D2F1